MRQRDDRPPLGRLVGQAGQQRRLGERLEAHARHRQELGRHPVAVGDGAGLVEQQRVDVAGGLDRAAAGGDDVLLEQAVHPRDPDRGQQAADGGRDQADQQRHDRRRRERQAGVLGQRHQRHAGEQEDDGEADQQDVQRDLVGRLLAGGPFDERDHPIEEGLAGIADDADDDPVGEHLGAAGDRRAIAAALADDGRRLAGDGRFVDGGNPLDDLAVAGDQLIRLDDHQIALAQQR